MAGLVVEEAQINPDNGKLKNEFDHYLNIRKSDKHESGYTINIREAVIAQELANAGWLATVSNHIQDAGEAIRIYREKDVVEKGFLRLKHNLVSGTPACSFSTGNGEQGLCWVYRPHTLLPHPQDHAEEEPLQNNDDEGSDQNNREAENTSD